MELILCFSIYYIIHYTYYNMVIYIQLSLHNSESEGHEKLQIERKIKNN